MFFLVAFVIGAATVPMAKGRLGAFGDLRLRWGPALLSAVALQSVILFLIPDHSSGIHEPLHIASYVLIGAFVLANIRVPGMWLIALDGLCNAVVIVLNGGVMYVSRTALERVGLYPLPDGWLNAAVLEHPKLALLGDVFPIPVLKTVVSFGDILIAIGAIALVHGVCGSRLLPAVTRAMRLSAHDDTTLPRARNGDSTSSRGASMIETPNTGRKPWQAKTKAESQRRSNLRKT